MQTMPGESRASLFLQQAVASLNESIAMPVACGCKYSHARLFCRFSLFVGTNRRNNTAIEYKCIRDRFMKCIQLNIVTQNYCRRALLVKQQYLYNNTDGDQLVTICIILYKLSCIQQNNSFPYVVPAVAYAVFVTFAQGIAVSCYSVSCGGCNHLFTFVICTFSCRTQILSFHFTLLFYGYI